jgi:hypothetical protein
MLLYCWIVRRVCKVAFVLRNLHQCLPCVLHFNFLKPVKSTLATLGA